MAYEDVLSNIDAIIKKSKILVSVNTLKYMVKNGRVSKVTGLIAKLMNLKPVISIDQDGNGIILEKALSIKKNTKIIVEEFRNAFETKGIERYCVVHSNDET